MKSCANLNCQRHFEGETFNQKFCSPECRRVVTNARLMERYYETRDRRNGKKRACKSCARPLSRYNESDTCTGCQSVSNLATRDKLLEMIGA